MSDTQQMPPWIQPPTPVVRVDTPSQSKPEKPVVENRQEPVRSAFNNAAATRTSVIAAIVGFIALVGLAGAFTIFGDSSPSPSALTQRSVLVSPLFR